MNIPAVKAYTNPVIQNPIPLDEDIKVFSQKAQKTKTNEFNSDNNLNYQKNGNGLLSKNERAFFVKLFPENSAQIENHILFTKNGKVQTSNTKLGSIVDGRV